MDQTLNQKYQIIEKPGADRVGSFYSLKDGSKAYYAKLIHIDERFTAKEIFDLQLKWKKRSSFLHGNAITVYEPEIAEEGLILKQNYLTGQSLDAVIRKSGRPLSRTAALAIASDIISALASLHSQGLVHGEIDSAHILLDNNGRAYLSFLPFAPLFDNDAAFYHDPRTVRQAQTKQDDVYAFGLILVTLFTGFSLYRPGRESFEGDEVPFVQKYYEESLDHAGTDENRDILPIITRCLSADLSERYLDCEELYWVIHQIAEIRKKPEAAAPKPPSRPVGTQPQSLTEMAQKESPEHKNSIVALLCSALLLLAAGIFLIFRWKAAPKDTDTPDYRDTLSVLYITQTSLADEAVLAETEAIEETETPEPTVTLTPEPTATLPPMPISEGIGQAILWQADGSRMLSVPEGSFTIGANAVFNYHIEGLLPRSPVFLDGFWMDETEVTQEQYAKCVNAGICQPVEKVSDALIGDQMPILNVTWDDAKVYCAWVGKRLPTEAEWEKAARGSDRRLYPWGNTSPDVYETASFHPVGADPKDLSPFGIRDLGGNVSEWTSDFFSETWLMNENEMENPIGPITGNMHTVKGGNAEDPDRELSAFVFRRWGSSPYVSPRYGFRCVVSSRDVDTNKAVMEPGRAAVSPALGYLPGEGNCEDKAGFVEDVTIPDGSSVKAGEMITKTWRLKNVGTCPWNENYKILWIDENLENKQTMFDVGVALQPGEEGDVSITFPAQGEGKTKIAFMLANTDGETFGLGERGKGSLWIEYNAE